MSIARNWKGLTTTPDVGQSILHEIGWQSVTVKRASDSNRNVGVTAELDDEIVTFTIKARIDPLETKEGTRSWVGLVQHHLLPMMAKNDHWLVQKPNEKLDEYRVLSINADEIMLEKA